MKIKSIVAVRCVIVQAILLSVLVSCNAPAGDGIAETGNMEDILQKADSLIDIAPDSSLILCRKFLEKYPVTTDSLYARVKLIEGNAHFSIGDVDEAINAAAEARHVAAGCGDDYVNVNATADLGVMNRVAQKPDTAIKLYNEALEMIRNGEFKDEKAHVLTSLAVLYANTGHLDEAKDYADKAVAAARDCGDLDMIMYASSQAGAIYNLLGEQSRALSLTRDVLYRARESGMPRYQLKALGHLIDIFLKAGQKDSVMHYLSEGEELAGSFPQNSVEGLGFLEEKYVVLSALGRNRESIDIQKQLLRLGGSAATFMPVEKIWLRMSRNYASLGLNDSARICYERAFELSDSIRGADTDRQLSEYYARFKTSEKELALVKLEKEKSRSDMWIAVWLGIASFLAAAIIAAVLYIRAKKKQEDMKILAGRISGIEEERGRLGKELHDGVCNDLYGIEMLMQSGTRPDEILSELDNVRIDVRRISHQLMPPSLQDVSLQEAIAELVGKLRHSYSGCRFLLSDLTGGMPVSENIRYNIYRISQELVGNMMRHAKPSEVSVSIAVADKTLYVTFEHDGRIDHSEDSRHGIGIESVKERLISIGASAQGLPFSNKIIIKCTVK